MRGPVKLLTKVALIVYLCSLLVMPVSAASASLTVWPAATYAGTTHYSSGAVLSLYKLANMTLLGNSIPIFTLTSEFSGLRINLLTVPTDRTSYDYNDVIQDYIWEHGIRGQEVTTHKETQGKALFDSLEPGLYFFAMVGASPEYTMEYLPLRCFTVSIPILTEGYQEAKRWEYHVTVYPKLASMEGYYFPLWEDGYYPGYPMRPSAPDYPLVDPETGEGYDPDDPMPPNAPSEPTEPTKPSDGPVDLTPPSGDNLPQTGLARLPVVVSLAIGGLFLLTGILLWIKPREDEE